MSSWFCNHVTISEISETNIAKLSILVKGDNYPYHTEATCKATKLLIAGYAGIFRPTHLIGPMPHLALIDHFNVTHLDAQIGDNTFENAIFTEFLEMLKPDLKLTRVVSEKIIELYDQSKLTDIKWSMLTDFQQDLIGKMFSFKGADWFGMAIDRYNDLGYLWSTFDLKPHTYNRLDMRFVIPTYLLAEINGKGFGIFKHLDRSISLIKTYGPSGPVVFNQSWDFEPTKGITIRFDTPLQPPKSGLFSELSNRFQCKIEHSYTDFNNLRTGTGRYQNGQIVDLLSK